MDVALAIAVITHVGDKRVSFFVYSLIFTVMLAVHRLHTFGQPDEADGQAAVFKQIADRLVR
ncbi:hypothetical protein D3C76_1858740 [compost metagenome]